MPYRKILSFFRFQHSTIHNSRIHYHAQKNKGSVVFPSKTPSPWRNICTDFTIQRHASLQEVDGFRRLENRVGKGVIPGKRYSNSAPGIVGQISCSWLPPLFDVPIHPLFCHFRNSQPFPTVDNFTSETSLEICIVSAALRIRGGRTAVE